MKSFPIFPVSAMWPISLIFSITLTAQPARRVHDPVVIQGASVPAFLGKSVDAIRVYSYNAGENTWQPVLFQIDERDDTDSYIGQKDGLLSDQDEIVFLAGDMGHQAPDDNWPGDIQAKQGKRLQLRINDPLDPGSPGFVYLFDSQSLARLGTSLFTVSQDEDRVRSSTYTVTHGVHGFQNGLYLNTSAGGDSLNIIERQKFRVIGKIDYINEEIGIQEEMSGSIKILNGMESINTTVAPKSITYIADPKIRVHRYLDLEYRFKASISVLGFSFKVDKQGTYQFLTTYYPTYAEWKSGTLEITEIDNVNIREIRLTTDLRPNALGMNFYNPYNTDPIRIDLTQNNYDDTINWPGDSWHLIVANPDDPNAFLSHASLLTITRIPTIPDNSNGHLYLKESMTAVKYDTGDNMSWGDSGWQMKGNSLTGMINFNSATYYLPENLTIAQAETLSAMHLNPLYADITEQVMTYRVTLDILPWEGGTVTMLPPISKHPANSQISITAKPKPGYRFEGWTGDIESTANPLLFEITDNVQINAVFVPYIHQIAVHSEPQGLNFTADGDLFVTPAIFSWEELTSHTIAIDSIIQIDDASRWKFSDWEPHQPVSFDYQVEARDTLFSARFNTQFRLLAETEDPVTGTVQVQPSQSWFDEGSVVHCTAVPGADYSFSHWSGDTTAAVPTLILTMDRPQSVTAHFSNAPPVISDADTVIAEDHTLKLTTGDLARWIQDDATTLENLVFTFAGSGHLTADFDAENDTLTITPEPQWSGLDTVWITAADPLGAFSRAPLAVTVTQEPDPPGHFSLLSPDNHTGITDWPVTMEFLWESATDPDPGDTLTYIFELDTSSTFRSIGKIRIDHLQWTQYILLWPGELGDNRYYWRVLARDRTGLVTECNAVFSLELNTDAESGNDNVPKDFVLEQNYPNPFNGTTILKYGLPRDEHVTLIVYNSHGQQVRRLWDGMQNAGYHLVQWNGLDIQGQAVSSGMYMIVLQYGNHRLVRKALLLQ
ncbi:T9SS type A sorting domain-containing protein [bacterium]|nr:T9SS type A sorting domain-containing protein [bacterium]